MDFHTTQLQITHRLHFPSSTAPTQLFTMITLAPVFHLTITITQSHTHTHTHYINPGLSLTHCRVLFSPATLLSVSQVFLDCLPVFDSCPCSLDLPSALPFGLCYLCFGLLPSYLDYPFCLALWIKFADRRPTLV